MKISWREYALPLRHTFTISRESHDTQPTLIVELEEDGLMGYGEATSNPYYGVTLASLQETLSAVRPRVENSRWTKPEEFWETLRPDLEDQPFAQCALDQAAYDLWGKQQGQPVYRLWNLSLERIPGSCYTIGIDSTEAMINKLQEMPGWPAYKIKLGASRDLEIVRALREHTSAPFRVDANCGWSVEEAIRNSEEMASLGVEFIEQPLPAEDWKGQREVYSQSKLPTFADESCQSEADVDRCAGHFHGINIKLVKCGGLTPARRMIDAAKKQGLLVMVGCMTESSVGISAIAQLLPLLDFVDMDGAALLARDIADGVRVERGICHYPDRPGLGVKLLSEDAG